ncbi:hypothetical protein CLONEX_00224 [[Clostridium] nexile DSM 1787]|nr:hypothetical protein CLONEX_00224 [[Clostridium] nexile DSM 1787]
MTCTEHRFNAGSTGFVEKSKYRKMMLNIGQYCKIGSTKSMI